MNETYVLSTHLFLRFLGFIYVIVFFPYLFQIKGLIGEGGILPANKFFERFGRLKKKYYHIPSLFWWNASNSMLIGTITAGIFLGFMLALGFYPVALLPLLFLIQLSVIYAGQEFLMFGWELFLLEITANAFFLALSPAPNALALISMWLLIFRFHFEGGAVKLLSRDPNWRNLTGVWWHYQSQPLPNSVAWFAHKLPMPFHKFSCFLMLFIELVMPFGVFGPDTFQLVVWFSLVGLQLGIWATGNFSYLNYLTVVVSTPLLSDRWLSPLFGVPDAPPENIFLQIVAGAGGAALIFLQIITLWNHLLKPVHLFSRILRVVGPFYIANRYGIFAVMTTTRYEIIIEGSNDGVHWNEYLFWYKPSETNRRPRRIAPYQPRLDWQAWFLPFSEYESEPWFQSLLYHLLKGSPDVLALIRGNPFPEKPPRYIRAIMYDYTYTDWKNLQEKGEWWNRNYIGAYSPTLSLKER